MILTCILHYLGDFRVNQNPGIGVLTTIFLRVHNYVVKELAKVQPSWNDEKLYQEGRRIVIALLQHISYKEYLPVLLGKQYMTEKGILAKDNGYTTYDPNIDPRVSSEFVAAAFRVFHSNIQGQLL